jgi:hypothetical protein
MTVTPKWILVLIAVILVVAAAVGVVVGHVDLFELGIAAFFASFLVP